MADPIDSDYHGNIEQPEGEASFAASPLLGEWRAVKYPDSKTWSVVGEVTIARGIREQSDAELMASAPRLRRLMDRLDAYLRADASSEACKDAYDELEAEWRSQNSPNK